MIRTLVLVLSLAANGALLGAVFRTAPANRAPGVAQSTAPQPTTEGDDRHPLSAGLDEHEARLLRAAELETAARRSLLKSAPYWQAGRGRAVERAAQFAAAMAEVRRELEAEFGAGAAELPEFARAFRPLDGELDFLTSSQQLAVQGWRLQQQRAFAATAPGVSAAMPAAVKPSRTAGPAALWTVDSQLDELAAILPPDAAFDVAVRGSPLADRLRATGVAFDEREFRDTFASLGSAASTAPDPNEQITLRRQLRALLGPERFHRVWSSRDPVAAAVQRVGATLGLSDTAAASAYAVVNDSQERLMELAAGGDLASERTIAAAQSIAADERGRLSALVGEQAAGALLDARAELWMAPQTMTGGTPPQ